MFVCLTEYSSVLGFIHHGQLQFWYSLVCDNDNENKQPQVSRRVNNPSM